MFNDKAINLLNSDWADNIQASGEGGNRWVHEKDSFILIVYSNDDYFSLSQFAKSM